MMGRPMMRTLMLGLLLVLLTAVGVTAAGLSPALQRKIVQAQQLLADGQYEQALEVLGRQGNDTDHYLLDFSRGNAYLLADHPDQALPWFERVTDKAPDYVPGWLNLAQAGYRCERFETAARAFEQAYALSDPPRPGWLYNAALCHVQQDRLPQAKALLLRLINQDAVPVEPAWRAALVQIYLQQNLPQDAMPHLEILARDTLGDDQRRWREILVQQYMALARLEAALQALSQYTEDDGLNPRWWMLLTSVYLEREAYRQALVSLKVVAYLRPLTAQELQLLGDLHLQLGVPEQAERYYQQLFEQRPGDDQVLTRLAHACLNQHQPEQALEWASRGEDSDPLLRPLQGQLLFRLGRYAEALDVFEALARQSSSPGALWLMAGYAAWNAESWERARQALRQARRYPQQRKPADQLLNQLEDGAL